MNLLEIAELRERLKEDIATVERFMDIVRREQNERRTLPPTIEEQLRAAANIRDATPRSLEPTTFKCDVCLREYRMQRLAPFDDLFGKAECLDCQETRRPFKAKECKSC